MRDARAPSARPVSHDDAVTDDRTDDTGLPLPPIDHPSGRVDAGALRATSDRLLQLVDEVAAAERGKRMIPAGSTEFVTAANDVAVLVRRLARWADRERELATRTVDAAASGDLERVAIESVEPRPAHRILADWRDAAIRYELAPRDSAERARAMDDFTRHREEYGRMADDRRAEYARLDSQPE